FTLGVNHAQRFIDIPDFKIDFIERFTGFARSGALNLCLILQVLLDKRHASFFELCALNLKRLQLLRYEKRINPSAVRPTAERGGELNLLVIAEGANHHLAAFGRHGQQTDQIGGADNVEAIDAEN